MSKPYVELKTDLDHDLNLKEEHVVVSEGKLTISEGRKEINSVALGKIKTTYVESGFGVNKLIVKMKSGEETEFAYFTKTRSANFSKLAEAINDYFSKGKPAPKLAFEKEKSEQFNKMSTLMWLYSFGRKYKSSLLIGLIVSISVALVNLVPPYLLSVLIDSVILAPNPSASLFPLLIVVLLASFAAAMALSMLQQFILNKTGNKIVTDMRNKLFAHVIKLPPSFIDKMSTGRIISRLISDASNTQWMMTYGLPQIVISALTLFGIGAILFAMYPPLAIYVLIPIPFVIWLVIRYRRRADIMYYRNWRRSADMTSVISDIVPNYTIVKAASKEKFESGKFDSVSGKYYDSQIDLTKLSIWHWPVVGFITSLATIVIWWAGGHLVIGGAIQLGIITAFIAYLSMFYNPINQLGNIIPFVQQSITSGQRLREILDEPAPVLAYKTEHKARPRGDIEFNGVSFEYTHPFPTIKNVNLKIKEGSKTVFVGKSGSGKTTLAKLLLRLYELKEGAITVGGKNIATFGLDNLRNGIAYVPQEAVLFDNSVAYNIAYYSPTTKADPLEIMLACADAAIHTEVMRMPHCYDTNIGERGYALSGGQRQRLSIARGVLTDPNIVILDEVTSNLDAINASEVEATIEHFTKNRTSVSITHDASEIQEADHAVVMENGTVVEQGTPAELLKKKGKLASLMRTKAHKQFLKRAQSGPAVNMIARFITSSTQVTLAKGSRPSLINVSYKGRRYRDLTPQLPFPITQPQVVIFNERSGKPVLLVNDSEKMPGKSAGILEETLNVTNFKLKILQINKVRITGDGVEWFVKTDRGKRKIVTETRRSVKDLGKKLILIDKEGLVFEAERAKLDSRSNKTIDSTL